MFIAKLVSKLKRRLLITLVSAFFVMPSYAAIQTYVISNSTSPVYGSYTYDTSSLIFSDVSLKMNLSIVEIPSLDKLTVQNFFTDSGNGDTVGYVPGTVNFYTAAVFLGGDGKSRFIFNVEDSDGNIQKSASGSIFFSLISDQMLTIPEPSNLIFMFFGIAIIFLINHKKPTIV